MISYRTEGANFHLSVGARGFLRGDWALGRRVGGLEQESWSLDQQGWSLKRGFGILGKGPEGLWGLGGWGPEA